MLGVRGEKKGTERNTQQPTGKEKSPLPVQARQASKWTIPQDGGPSSVGQREMEAEGMQAFALRRPESNRAATKPPVKTPALCYPGRRTCPLGTSQRSVFRMAAALSSEWVDGTRP